MDKKILLVGTISNVAKSLERELKIVLASLSVFKSVGIFLVESDSKDNTKEILSRIQKSRQVFEFISKGNLSKSIPNRIERIAFCRNIYVEYIRNNYKNHEWDYIAVADLDGMNFKLSNKGIESCFNQTYDWSGLMANQKKGYYDLYALRAQNWVEEDVFEKIKEVKQNQNLPKRYKNSFFDFYSNFLHYDRIRQEIIYDNMLVIDEKSKPIKVLSAFGGFALYKPEVFMTSDYSVPLNNFASEHVEFHKSAGNFGHNFYINPTLINSNFNKYNLNRYRVIRFCREFKKFYLRKFFTHESPKIIKRLLY